MYLKIKKPFGKLKAGVPHETLTDEQGELLKEKGYAEEISAKEFKDLNGTKASKLKPVPASTTTTKAAGKPVAKTSEEE
jgi:hypothetical protein